MQYDNSYDYTGNISHMMATNAAADLELSKTLLYFPMVPPDEEVNNHLTNQQLPDLWIKWLKKPWPRSQNGSEACHHAPALPYPQGYREACSCAYCVRLQTVPFRCESAIPVPSILSYATCQAAVPHRGQVPLTVERRVPVRHHIQSHVSMIEQYRNQFHTMCRITYKFQQACQLWYLKTTSKSPKAVP
nr:unnamed protein product [Callosobruchus chinensis]